MQLGTIGFGLMGGGMARRLLHDCVVFDAATRFQLGGDVERQAEQ